MVHNPYSQYAAQSIMTMTPGEMLTRLYDGAVLDLNLAVQGIEEKDYEKVNLYIQKAQKIITYLTVTLDMRYPVSENLAALYDFFNYYIRKANIEKSAAMLKEVIPMIEDLRNTFTECDRLSRMSAQKDAGAYGISLIG